MRMFKALGNIQGLTLLEICRQYLEVVAQHIEEQAQQKTYLCRDHERCVSCHAVLYKHQKDSNLCPVWADGPDGELLGYGPNAFKLKKFRFREIAVY